MSRRMKDKLYEQFARIGKAIASPRRLELLEILAQGEQTVETLARKVAQPIANTSHHLQALREARLVEARKEGLYVFYRLTDDKVFELSRLIRQLAEKHLAEMDRIVATFLRAPDRMETVSREELLMRARAGTVLVLDVRPADEYHAGHIQGAISIPLDQLEQRIGEIPDNKDVVAYCRGPYCVMAHQAVETLRRYGRFARRLLEGFPEWRAAKLPVEESLSANPSAWGSET